MGPGSAALTIYLLPLVAPFGLLLAAAIAGFRPGKRPLLVPMIAEIAAVSAIAVSLCAVTLVIANGAGVSPVLGFAGAGLSVRLDAVSVTMLLLVSFIGWIVTRYSRSYLDGEAREGAFHGWLAATLGAVLFLVLSGNLFQLVVAWLATSLCLQRLLLFYPERQAAQRAARKKALFSTISAIALIAGCILLVYAYNSADITTINAAARTAGGSSWIIVLAAMLIAVAALLKSAQFPAHGWLAEVMEAPTPVSALLHAGVINAGGFLLIRFADVMLLAPEVLAVLAMIGGFTALFGGLVMLTQPAVKTSLAWSTVAQMGFMILQCGLALFPLALLHIVAHSLYKAHAFLASGGAVEQVTAIRRPGPVAAPNAVAVTHAFLAALAIYAVIGTSFWLVFGSEVKSPQALALGAILVLGVAYLLAQGLADAAPSALTRRASLYAFVAAVSYFALQSAAEWLTRGVLPPTPAPGRLEWTLIALAALSSGAVALAQALLPHWAHHPAALGLRVHISNGLYVNAVIDRLFKGWSVRTASQSAMRKPTC